ncbi:MAG: cephalosporin hydroxylase [Syntrophaceae bacterium]|nr:cephalosporin hydroxylase [Syntrophaceae bacterium]
MSEKKLYTRQEFEEVRRNGAREMMADKQLVHDALDVKVRAGRYFWVHQTTWLGEPILQLPQDMFAIQEIVFRTRPRYIIELGVAWGGSLLFYSSLMQILGGDRIVGVDIFVPDDLVERLKSHGPISERITLLQGSSVEKDTVERIREIVGPSRDVMVILDSHHSHDHVLKELRLYSPLIGKNHYLVCSDTVIEYQPAADYRPRPWGKGNNPKTALDEFLNENDRFIMDREVDDKLLFTCIPGGYLKCCRD